jgi:II/X family phage/plasmid replication protein
LADLALPMIDWATWSAPLDWGSEPICGGHLVSLDRTGKIERATLKSAHVRGSFDEHLTLRTVRAGRVEVDGNPSKFLQGHNLFGSDDLPGLLDAALTRALTMLGRPPTPQERALWVAGDFVVSRVDLTNSFALPCRSDVAAWIRAASELGRIRWRGRGMLTGSTLYFGKVAAGKRAGDWSLKFYGKAEEIEARSKGHKLPENLPSRDALVEWVQNNC